MKSNNSTRSLSQQYQGFQRRKLWITLVLCLLVLLFMIIGLALGSSSLSFLDSIKALFGVGEATSIRIVQKIRLPRVLAGVFAGMGLALSGLIMQSCLDNPMASPSTLGVSNASVLGANLAILLFSGGMIETGNGSNWNSFNPYGVSSFAFVFAIGSVLLILLLSRIKGFSTDTIILSGVALSAIFSAITTLIQYFATDTQLSSAVFWTFGDLGRATMTQVYIMMAVVLLGWVLFFCFRYPLNALLLGDDQAKSLGIKTGVLRAVLLTMASLMTAVCISFLGIIGFVGLIAPHIMRRLVGNDHRYLIPSTALMGSLVLLISDTVSRVIMNGLSLPVGAVTALLGAPFFLFIIFRSRKDRA